MSMAEARRKNAGPRNSESAPSALGANESADAGEANNLTSEPQSGAGAAANPAAPGLQAADKRQVGRVKSQKGARSRSQGARKPFAAGAGPPAAILPPFSRSLAGHHDNPIIAVGAAGGQPGSRLNPTAMDFAPASEVEYTPATVHGSGPSTPNPWEQSAAESFKTAQGQRSRPGGWSHHSGGTPTFYEMASQGAAHSNEAPPSSSSATSSTCEYRPADDDGKPLGSPTSPTEQRAAPGW